MSEHLREPQFAEQLPKSAEFNRSRKMAISAAELADATKAQLEEEVADKNAELKAQGLIGSEVELETSEKFTFTDEGLIYSWDALHGQQIAGRFNGLTVLDTRGAIISNESGFKLEGLKPDRFVVCALIDAPEAQKFVPLRGIESPRMPRETYDDLLRTA